MARHQDGGAGTRRTARSSYPLIRQGSRRLAGRDGSRFGAIPHLLGRRIGGRFRSRERHLARVAVASYRDGWLNEGLSASDMEARARMAENTDERYAFERIAAEERGHAELGRDVVLWCSKRVPSPSDVRSPWPSSVSLCAASGRPAV
jgi:hypothetical protein